MESRRQDHVEKGCTPPPPPIRESAFSRPLLPPNSSLVSPRGGRDTGVGGGEPGNGDVPLPPNPTSTRAADRFTGLPVLGGTGLPPTTADSTAAKYRECLRNHAASLGGHVLDGCCEFMPGGDAGTPAALNCAACGCHRSFHRKAMAGSGDMTRAPIGPHSGVPLLLPPPLRPQSPSLSQSRHPHPHHQHTVQKQRISPPLPAAPAGAGSGGAATESSSEERNRATPRSSSSGKKRFRTKFTPEQKEKMLSFAESVGWRLPKPDNGRTVEEFCAEVGVSRRVLKVWMHNNKHTLGKLQQPHQPHPPAPPPVPPAADHRLLHQEQQQHMHIFDD